MGIAIKCGDTNFGDNNLGDEIMVKPSNNWDRRQFLTNIGMAAGATMLGTPLTSTLYGTELAAPSNLRWASKTLLQPSDFTYLGYYNLALGGEFSYGAGLAHRYIDKELRFLALTHVPGDISYQLMEIIAPELNEGVNKFFAQWQDLWKGLRRQGGMGQHHGIWWNEAKKVLWSTAAVDYPNDNEADISQTIILSDLGNNGTTKSVHGLIGLEGISARRIYGGFTSIPAWFQNKYKTGPYAVGFGGYASRVTYGKASMGPVLIAIPDPADFPNNTNIPTDKYQTLMDYSDGTVTDVWYPKYSHPISGDRGARTPDVINEYDSWTSPAPDGFGRWTWGDSAYQTGIWIDLPDKHGFIIIPTVQTGRTWYQNSNLNAEGKTAEFQVYDPYEFGEVLDSKRKVWDVKPKHIWRPKQFPVNKNHAGNTCQYTACAASFDTTRNRLYVRWTFYEGDWPHTADRIFVWQVG
jgi:hypothetical protein